MVTTELAGLVTEQNRITSHFLEREVVIDFYVPKNFTKRAASLLLINDGQDLSTMNFAGILNPLLQKRQIQAVLCVGIHAGDRMNEYGTANRPDYAGRGYKASQYTQFILQELLPYIQEKFRIDQFKRKSFAGFSLGGLSALDIVWNYPQVFTIAGVFSGSLWWRSKDLNDGYNDDTDRIMHQQILNGKYYSHLRFYFTTGSFDETSDRNNNGVIDSIDDTLDLITELKKKGYKGANKIKYINIEDGYHDVATWGRAMPHFLLWAFGWGWGKI